MPDATVAFIGGSGLYDIEGFADRRDVDVPTPFGAPSDTIALGTLGNTPVAFLPRHGRGHRLSPTEIPARANIYALKALGVERIVSLSAVGSLREEIRPLDVLIPHQLIDRTRTRASTFFGEGIVAHVGFADPFCPQMASLVASAATDSGATTHPGGTYVVMEGPQFSTRAESALYRSWGASVIGMTALPEAKLAREAEICYATIALVTDYDCWRDGEEPVSVELVVANLGRNVETSRSIIRELVGRIPAKRTCPCASALENAIITRPDRIPPEAAARLSIIVSRYLKAPREVV